MLITGTFHSLSFIRPYFFILNFLYFYNYRLNVKKRIPMSAIVEILIVHLFLLDISLSSFGTESIIL